LALGGFKLQIYLLVNKAAVDALRWLISHFWWIVWAAALLIFVGAVTVFRGAMKIKTAIVSAVIFQRQRKRSVGRCGTSSTEETEMPITSRRYDLRPPRI